MTSAVRYVGVFFAAALLVTGSSVAASAAYLKVPGAQGDSTNAMLPGVQGWSPIASWSWGAGRGIAGGATPPQGPGRVTITTSSRKMMQLCATGRHFSQVVLDVGGRSFVLDDVSIVAVSHPMARKSQGRDVPTETVTFNFTKVHLTYTPQ
jgi:type VI protein secretion system component Hcp